MRKQDAPEGWETAILMLEDRQSKKRRSGAKRLRKMRYRPSGPQLLDALRRELQNERSWETQYHMIMALGECGWEFAVPFLQKLSGQNFEHTMLYMALGDALVRLTCEGGDRSETVDYLLRSHNAMLIEGGLRGLAMTETVISEEDALRLLRFSEALAEDERGMWCRVWGAAAAAGWKYDGVRGFLNRWAKAEFDHLAKAAAMSLQGRYPDLALL